MLHRKIMLHRRGLELVGVSLVGTHETGMLIGARCLLVDIGDHEHLAPISSLIII